MSEERRRYITPEGFRALQAELAGLWKRERPQVVDQVAHAAALGDRSENAEYIYGKKRLREIDRRIRYLQKLLDRLTVVEYSPRQEGRVFFGAVVTVEDEEGEEKAWRIVGPDEFDVSRGRISVESPLGKALIGRREGDTVDVRRPSGAMEFTVVGIRYEESTR